MYGSKAKIFLKRGSEMVLSGEESFAWCTIDGTMYKNIGQGIETLTFKNGLLNSIDDKPAMLYKFTGSKSWYKDGVRHREHAPAFEWENGGKYMWFLNGDKLNEKEILIHKRFLKLKNI